MSLQQIINYLDLPQQTRVDQRIPKKTLGEYAANTPADRRLIQNGIDELNWLAALKPHTAGIPAYHDDSRDYLEIAVLTLVARTQTNSNRLCELIHRAIPYPTLLIASQDDSFLVSIAHKRNALNQANSVVIDRNTIVADWPMMDTASPSVQAFLKALSIASAPRVNLFDTYNHWQSQIIGLRTAYLAGAFVPAVSLDDAHLRESLQVRCESIYLEINALRNMANRERMMSRRVDHNLQIKRLETELTSLRSKLLEGQPSHESIARNNL